MIPAAELQLTWQWGMTYLPLSEPIDTTPVKNKLFIDYASTVPCSNFDQGLLNSKVGYAQEMDERERLMAHRDANLVTLGFVVLFVRNQSLEAHLTRPIKWILSL